MIPTSLVIIPDKKGGFHNTMKFAKEYARVSIGVLGFNHLLNVYYGSTLCLKHSELNKTNNISDEFAKTFDKDTYFLESIHELYMTNINTIKHGRAIFFYEDSTYLPDITDLEKLFFELQNRVKEYLFDKLIIEIYFFGDNFQPKKISNIKKTLITRPIPGGHKMTPAFSQIIEEHLFLSKISFSGISLYYINPFNRLSISADYIEQSQKKSVLPRVIRSFKAVLQKDTRIAEMDLKDKVFIIDNKYQWSMDNGVMHLSEIDVNYNLRDYEDYAFSIPNVGDISNPLNHAPRILKIAVGKGKYSFNRNESSTMINELFKF